MKNAATIDAYEAVFTALAHPARRRILMTINFEGGRMSAGAIARIFEHSWPTTTRHLKVLARAGLIKYEKDGRNRFYVLDRSRLGLLRDWLAWFAKNPINGEKK